MSLDEVLLPWRRIEMELEQQDIECSYVRYFGRVKVEECKSHVLIRTLSYFSKWKR